MDRIIAIFLFAVLLVACGSGRSGTDRPGGMTGTSGTSTTGTGTAAPTGTIGTGGTTDPASPGAVIPKEGESDKDDSAITETVVARLKAAGFGDSVQVETDQGVVTLKGTASSQDQIEQIIKMVQAIPEVESVTSEMTIR